MKTLTCLLLFAALTYEDSTFGSGSFHTVLAFQEPLFAGNPLKPWDVAVILVGLASLVRPKNWRQQVAPLNLALLGCTAGLLMMVGWGVARGGDLRMAYFQLAGLLRMLLLYPVVQAVFRTPRDLGMLALAILAAALYRGAACIAGHRFFLANLGTIEWPEYITDHHDSVLWTLVVIGLVSFLLARHRFSTALLVAPIATVILLGIHYNERRLAWLQLVGGLGLALLLMPPGRVRRRMSRWAVIAAPLVLVYVAVGWGRPGAVFAPVRQISSMFDTQTDDSNIYRDLENAGVIVTLQRTRALGTGFGHRFEEISDRYSGGMASGWDEYRFTPHNSVLGLASAAGAVGFPLVWAFLPVGAFFAARARAFATQPLEQALASAAFAYPFVYGVQAFGDMGLQSFKANVLLACCLATAARLSVLTGGWTSSRQRRVTAPSTY